MTDSDRTMDPDRRVGDDAPTFMPSADTPKLEPGAVLAGRYQIVDMLGAGGMGAVYRAFDRQLTRLVALKTILPEMAATPVALKRFKQEVLLAQSIVHKNVVRIFDIGEDGLTKFITMDFIDGSDLKSLILKRGKLPPEEAAGIIRQVCEGLEAAHAAGVVHRDLKPQNIMIENGRVVVMDFGIAHSGQSRGVTQTGSFIGTPEYMSPEQAQTEEVDARSDIFSLGLIFYEMLTGRLPFQGKTVLETMFKRTTERAMPPVEMDQTVPKDANDIIVKCLEKERDKRYQSVTALLEDLKTFDPVKKVGASERARAKLKRSLPYRGIAATVGLLIVALAAGYLLRNQFSPSPPVVVEHAPMNVLIADFTNQTGEKVFDGALEPVVKMALEDAGFITAYDRVAVVRDLRLPPIAGRLDAQAAQQLAIGQGLGVVVSGSLERKGNGFSLSMRAIEAVTGNVIHTVEDSASGQDQVLYTTTRLVGDVRKALGDDVSESAVRFAMETLSANNLEAVHDYAAAMEALANGKQDEALQNFSKAVDIDDKFGLAYAGMAIVSRNQGRQEDAEKYIKLALAHIDRMTERERYRTRGSYYLVLGDQQKCVDEYRALINRFSSDAAAHNNLAVCLVDLRNIPEALKHVRQATTILPKRASYRWNLSVYESFGNGFDAGERAARELQKLDSKSPLGWSSLAFALLGKGQSVEAAKAYEQLLALGKELLERGKIPVSQAKSGLADVAIYEGRFEDAARLLQVASEEDIAAGNSDRAGAKFAALAYTRLAQGRNKAAVDAAQSALNSSKTVRTRFLAARVLAAAGDTAGAQKIAASLATELQSAPQTYAKLIEGEIALAKRDPRVAITTFKAANSSLDTWIGRFGLGRAYLDAGAFQDALLEFDVCINRRGEALSLFLDDSPTYGYLPAVYYYLGRAREGNKAAGFAESYKTYLSIREKAGEDPLIADARKRAGN